MSINTSRSNSTSYSYSSSAASSASSEYEDDYELFETIPRLPTGIHVVYNPQAVSTHNKTSRYIPASIENFPIHVHNPRKSYKGIDKETLWGMACSSVQNTMHLVKDENEETYEVHTCDPAMDSDYFEFDKLNSTTNMIIMLITPHGPTASNKMKTFILCRDLHPQTLKKMRTKERQNEYQDNGDFLEYMEFEGEPCLYVDGLCSKQRGAGKLLMGLLNTIVDKSPHYKAIKLAALTYVVKYYYKLGYRFAHSPNPNFSKNKSVSIDMLRDVNNAVENLPKIAKDDEFKSAPWIEFLNKVQQYKLFNTDYDTKITKKQKKRMNRPTTYYDPITDKFERRAKTYRKQKAVKSHDLGANGWYMYKMFNKSTTTTSQNKTKRAQTPPRRSLTIKLKRKHPTPNANTNAKSKSKTIKRQKLQTPNKTKSRSKSKRNSVSKTRKSRN